MPYIHPSLVRSPKDRISNVKVLADKGENKWSLAEIVWDGEPCLGIRWNGGSDDKNFPGIGNPQSRGVPTWFILPGDLEEILRMYLESQEKK